MTRSKWTCPRCGRSLTIPNQEHVCGLYDLEIHFDGKDPLGRIAFDWMSDVFQSLGEHDVLPMKTMIAFASGVNIAFLKTKRRGAEVSLVLTARPCSDRIKEEVAYSRTKSIYRIPVFEENDLDTELESWLRLAYELRT